MSKTSPPDPQPSAPTHDGAGVRFPPPLVYVLALGAGFALERWWPATIVPGSAVLLARIAGAVLILGWAVLSLAAFRAFGRAGTTVHPNHPTTALVGDGPYRFTRNPLYLGMALLGAGVALAANALWPLLTVPLALAAIQRWVVAREEGYLEAKFGEAYLDYKRRVRRWL